MSHALTFRAVYIPIIQTTYIDENGEQQDVDAVRLTKANIEDNKLDCDWYLIDSESDIDADYTIRTTKSLNIILADGAYKYCKNITAVEDLNIYGQAKQTGTLDISASNEIISPDNYTQYGGVVKAYMIRADYNCEFKGGILDVKSQFKGLQSTKLSWMRFSKDQVKINTILGSAPIADGFGFTDGENTYTGSVPSSAAGKTLTPAAVRNYSSTPTWTWSDDHSEAFATFQCTDAGHEDETVSVAANIEARDFTHSIKYKATCDFKGKSYKNEVNVTIRYRVYTSKTGEGTLSVSGDTYMSPGEKITVTATPALGYVLNSLTVNPYPYDENIKISLKGDNTFKMP